MPRGIITSLSVGAGLALGATVLLGAPPSAGADDESALGQGGGSLILVLDGSGSMEEPGGQGRTRMEEAKAGLDGVIDDLPDDANVGLRVYGSEISDGPGSCEDSELLVPVAPVDRTALRAGVRRLAPLGNTPIAYSLEQAYADLPEDGPRSIVLVSDGEENCQGDPCEVAADLRKKGADFYVDVVGLQVDPASRDQLTCIASAGGGTYYDVTDLSRLQDTLTRTSVRAARGYEPAGLPVEGGASVESAVEIEDGQWLDTIGDSGDEHYALPDPGEGTVHVSAATPPSVDSGTAAERVELTVVDAAGAACGPGARAFVQGLTNVGSPLSVGYSLTPEVRETCGAGPYVMQVRTPDVEGVQPLEVLVRSERALETAQGLPAGSTAGSGFSDEVQGQDTEGGAVPVVGGPNFSSAAPTAPGAYEDSILMGETLFYRIPDVGWGQQAVCDVAAQGTASAEGALSSRGYRVPVRSRMFGPLKSPIDDPSSAADNGSYGGSSTVELHLASPVVAYRNRESNQAPPLASALDGDYYCAVTVQPIPGAEVGDVGEIPLTLTTSIVGEEAGVPQYVPDPERAAGDESTDGAFGGWPLWAAVALGALLVGAVAVVGRRRGRAGATGSTSGD